MLMVPKYKIGDTLVMMVNADMEIVVKVVEIMYDNGEAAGVEPGFNYFVDVANTSSCERARESQLVPLKDYNGV